MYFAVRLVNFSPPGKTHVVVKSPELVEQAREPFGPTVKITSEGHRHIGAALGDEAFRQNFVKQKVENWSSDLMELVEIAKEEPQAALCAFNAGLSRRWTFLQRTMSGIRDLFVPLEEIIRQKFIPAICGRNVSDLERQTIALPYRFGGLGIRNPVEAADDEYQASLKVTEPLVSLIISQECDLTKLDQQRVSALKKELVSAKEAKLAAEAETIAAQLDDKGKRLLKCAQEKGASAWLSALPLKKLGYCLNKKEFRDAVCMRYGWEISELPRYCACGERNTIDHVFICKRGGYVCMRHNALRDVEASIMKEVCSDIQVEPVLMPTEAEVRGNIAVNARLDIAARGVWGPAEKTFFDVKVTYPLTDSNMAKSLTAMYTDHQQQKKRMYSDRVLNVEKASFTPLIFTTAGGMAPECRRFHKRIARMIS